MQKLQCGISEKFDLNFNTDGSILFTIIEPIFNDSCKINL